jgi:hypothetical protein
VAAGAVALVSALGGLALADAPVRTGWWNAATAGGVALPQPTTSADDLHVSQGASGPAAFAAVAYDLAGALTDATLVLKVVPSSAVGTVDVAACPTRDGAWKAGGNQTIDTAPGYDCAAGVPGLVAADGTTVTFLIDARQQAATGGLSLAVVPKADALPFSVDFAKPDASSLSATVETPAVTDPAPAEPATALPPPGPGTSGTAPLGGGSVAAPPALEPAGPAPVAAPALPQPQAAPAPQPAAPVRTAAAAEPISNRDRYIAGTLLALLSGAIVWALQQPTRSPRLIGGAARKVAPVAAAVVGGRPRGIGRFAALRTAPARRLV